MYHARQWLGCALPLILWLVAIGVFEVRDALEFTGVDSDPVRHRVVDLRGVILAELNLPRTSLVHRCTSDCRIVGHTGVNIDIAGIGRAGLVEHRAIHLHTVSGDIDGCWLGGASTDQGYG